MNKTIKCILAIITNNPKHILYRYYCPYCNKGTDSYEEMHDHLTYYEWMSVPAVDKIMKELEEKKGKKNA